MILETYLKVRTIKVNDLLIRFNGLIERRSKEELERVGASTKLFGKSTTESEEYEGKSKLPLHYPVVVCSEVYEGLTYFTYKDDLTEFLLTLVAVTGNPNVNEYASVFELLDDKYRIEMNGHKSDYFDGNLGDVIVENCEKVRLLGEDVYMKEKELFMVVGVL